MNCTLWAVTLGPHEAAPTRLAMGVGMLGTEHKVATAGLHRQMSFLSKVPRGPC